MNRIVLFGLVLLVLAGCRQHAHTEGQEVVKDSAGVVTPSDTLSVQSSSTGYQTMGKVMAERYADVKFEASLPVLRVAVHNGDHVRKGQLLAEQDAYAQKNAIEQHQREVEQARLQMEDVIIAQGYDPNKLSAVPQRVQHIASVKSGYALAQSKLAAAEHELTTTRVMAPFDGVIANVTARAGQLAQKGDVICRLIAEQQMDVLFRVMETDLKRFPVGTQIVIQPVADTESHYEATVREVNPVVDEQGTIGIRARIRAPHPLFDGMNVSISLKK